MKWVPCRLGLNSFHVLGACYCNKIWVQRIPAAPCYFPNAHIFKLVQIGGSWAIWCKTSNPIRNYQRLMCLFSPGVTYSSDYILEHSSLRDFWEKKKAWGTKSNLMPPEGSCIGERTEILLGYPWWGQQWPWGSNEESQNEGSTQRPEDDNLCFKNEIAIFSAFSIEVLDLKSHEHSVFWNVWEIFP